MIKDQKYYENLGRMLESFLKSQGCGLVASEEAFASYLINGEEAMIRDVYVKEEAREKRIASTLVEKIEIDAKKKGCKYISSHADLKTEGADVSMVAQVKYGFKPVMAQNNIITFLKEII